MELHDRIRVALRSARMSMAALARYCDVSRSAVSLWVHPDAERRTIPTEESLRRVSQATGVNYEWLAGETTENGPDPEHLEAESIAQRRRYRINAFQRMKEEVRERVRRDRPDLATFFDRSMRYMDMRWPFDFISDHLVLAIKPMSLSRRPIPLRHHSLTNELWGLAIWAKLDNDMINLRAHTLAILDMDSQESEMFVLEQQPVEVNAETLTLLEKITKQAEIFDVTVKVFNTPRELSEYIQGVNRSQ